MHPGLHRPEDYHSGRVRFYRTPTDLPPARSGRCDLDRDYLSATIYRRRYRDYGANEKAEDGPPADGPRRPPQRARDGAAHPSRICDRNLRENFAWPNRFVLSLLEQHPGIDRIAAKRNGCSGSEDLVLVVLVGKRG